MWVCGGIFVVGEIVVGDCVFVFCEYFDLCVFGYYLV